MKNGIKSPDRMLGVVLDTIPVRVFWKDLALNYLGCNIHFAADIGITDTKTIIGKNDFLLFSFKRAQKYKEEDLEILSKGIPKLHYEEMVVQANGNEIYFRKSKIPLKDDHGRIVGLLGAYEDITHLKQTENERRKLLRAIEQSPSSVVVTDRNGMIEYVNPKFTKVTGYQAEEAIGQNPRILNSGTQPTDFYKTMWETLFTGNEWRGEFCNKKKNGEIYWEFASISPIRNEQGEVTNFVAVKEDITEQKRLADEMESIRQAAEAANKAKSEFLANMSHEIRTPMNAIIGMTHLCLATELTPKQKEYLNMIRNASNSLIVIINDILDFSKIEAGRLKLESIEFQLLDLMRKISNNLRIIAQKKGLAITVFVDPGIPIRMLGDPVRLEQILMNLGNNAIKFTEKGDVQIKANLITMTQNALTLEFLVVDTGIGLSSSEIKRLFQPFTQADGSTTRKFGGTGLGLSICKRLVTMMHGHIGVESTPGRGSTFKFTVVVKPFPSTNAHRPPHTPQTDEIVVTSKLKSAIPHYNPAYPLKLLVAEDNELNQIYIKDILENAGIEVKIVSNGLETLEKFQEKEYNGILMDIQMPEMDGYETTQKIRKNNLKIPIIAMTAHALKMYKELSLKVGMNDYITKPIRPAELFQVLAKWLPNHFITSQEDRVIPQEEKHLAQTAEGPGLSAPLLKLLNQLISHVENMEPVPCKKILSEIQKLSLPDHHSNDMLQLSFLIEKYKFKDAVLVLNAILNPK